MPTYLGNIGAPTFFQCKLTYGPDRLELIIFDITGKKIDNDPSRLIMV